MCRYRSRRSFLFIFVVSIRCRHPYRRSVGDRYGRKVVIWGSILGTAPFSLLLPHVGLPLTAVMSFCAG